LSCTGSLPREAIMPSNLFDLTGRVAVVSGAAQGLGRAMATALAEAGADILLADRNAAGARATAEQLTALGRRAVAIGCDVSEPAQIRTLFAELDRTFGRIDFLGNVAGDGALGAPESIPLDDVERTWRQLVYGRFCACQEAGRRMLAAGRGSIVNIGSLASTTALGRGHIAYSMAMGAVVQMTRELSTEWSGRGVRVNAILPAQVVNPGLEKRMAADPGLRARFLGGIPSGRLGKPDDIKGLAVFLASDASAWITGALIPMDGGNLAMNAGGTVGKGTHA
jgi:NAD(P)-dependent dehydrogenase (short-subunit alcohol dehydrogenase family)